MAFHVLLIDDDLKIREGLRLHIDWDKLRYAPPLLASDGIEALRILQTRHIDLVITDIRMPGLSGLELSQIVSERYPHISIVILSAFHEFEYAKSAMKFGVRHYVTKPTDLLQLEQTLLMAGEEIDAQRQQTKRMKQLEQKYSEAVELLVEQFMVDMTHGAITDSKQIHSFLTDHKIELNAPDQIRTARAHWVYPADKEKLLLTYITGMDHDKAANMIDSIFEPLFATHVLRDTYLECFAKLYFAMESVLRDFGEERHMIVGEYAHPFKKMSEFTQPPELVEWLKQLALQMIDYLGSSKLPSSQKFVEAIKRYIDLHYMEDISLYTTSEEIHLSPAYISKLFRKGTGLSFIEYVTSVRMNRAKELLANIQIKIYEIGDMVGYKSTKHFSQVFKHATGMTPSEYRDHIRDTRENRP